MFLNCIIIEDEPLAAEKLKEYVLRTGSFKVKAVYDNPMNATYLLQDGSIDLLFLDINLKDVSGIEYLESIDFKGKVIITTAYDQYALKGYELDVVDYLLKPFSFDRFTKAIEKFKSHINRETQESYFFVRTEHRYEKINYDDLLFIKGMGDYRQIVCESRKIMTLQTFNEFEQILPTSKVVRVHKSYMVSMSNIETIEQNNITINSCVIPISKTYRESFFNSFKRPSEQYRNK